jgi:hypothetical protein
MLKRKAGADATPRKEVLVRLPAALTEKLQGILSREEYEKFSNTPIPDCKVRNVKGSLEVLERNGCLTIEQKALICSIVRPNDKQDNIRKMLDYLEEHKIVGAKQLNILFPFIQQYPLVYAQIKVACHIFQLYKANFGEAADYAFLQKLLDDFFKQSATYARRVKTFLSSNNLVSTLSFNKSLPPEVFQRFNSIPTQLKTVEEQLSYMISNDIRFIIKKYFEIIGVSIDVDQLAQGKDNESLLTLLISLHTGYRQEVDKEVIAVLNEAPFLIEDLDRLSHITQLKRALGIQAPVSSYHGLSTKDLGTLAQEAHIFSHSPLRSLPERIKQAGIQLTIQHLQGFLNEFNQQIYVILDRTPSYSKNAVWTQAFWDKWLIAKSFTIEEQQACKREVYWHLLSTYWDLFISAQDPYRDQKFAALRRGLLAEIVYKLYPFLDTIFDILGAYAKKFPGKMFPIAADKFLGWLMTNANHLEFIKRVICPNFFSRQSGPDPRFLAVVSDYDELFTHPQTASSFEERALFFIRQGLFKFSKEQKAHLRQLCELKKDAYLEIINELNQLLITADSTCAANKISPSPLLHPVLFDYYPHSNTILTLYINSYQEKPEQANKFLATLAALWNKFTQKTQQSSLTILAALWNAFTQKTQQSLLTITALQKSDGAFATSFLGAIELLHNADMLSFPSCDFLFEAPETALMVARARIIKAGKPLPETETVKALEEIRGLGKSIFFASHLRQQRMKKDPSSITVVNFADLPFELVENILVLAKHPFFSAEEHRSIIAYYLLTKKDVKSNTAETKDDPMDVSSTITPT